MSTRTGRNEPCPCGSGKKFKRCCADSANGASAFDALPGSAADLTLLVETPRGVMVRRVPSASPLRQDLKYGTAAEAATYDAAAVWGLPDFVYLPEQQAVGTGTRELGDGIIVVGDLAVVVQVKGRERPSADEDRERGWLTKKTADAVRQGLGTVRRVRMAPVELTNLRGRRITIDADRYRWLVAVVIDHPDPPEDFVPLSAPDSTTPTVLLLRRDWEFLFDQLKSTHAVAQYFERVGDEAIALGREPARYYEYAQADAAAKPQPFPAALVGSGVPVSTPLLPLAPAAFEDRPAHQVVRAMLEDIALTRLIDAGEVDRLRVLAELDRLPVGQRAQIGRFVLGAMDDISSRDTGEGVTWRLRSVRGDEGRIHLGFGVCSHAATKDLQHAFGLWVQLRHHDVRTAAPDVDDLTTVGVLLTPGADATGRPWDTTMAAVSGKLAFTAAELRELRALWPTPAPHSPSKAG